MRRLRDVLQQQATGYLEGRRKRDYPYSREYMNNRLDVRVDVQQILGVFKDGDPNSSPIFRVRYNVEPRISGSERMQQSIEELIQNVQDEIGAAIIHQIPYTLETNTHTFTLKEVEENNMRYRI